MTPLPLSVTVEDELVVEPSALLESRYDAEWFLEALWKGLPPHETSWVRVMALKQ